MESRPASASTDESSEASSSAGKEQVGEGATGTGSIPNNVSENTGQSRECSPAAGPSPSPSSGSASGSTQPPTAASQSHSQSQSPSPECGNSAAGNGGRANDSGNGANARMPMEEPKLSAQANNGASVADHSVSEELQPQPQVSSGPSLSSNSFFSANQGACLGDRVHHPHHHHQAHRGSRGIGNRQRRGSPSPVSLHAEREARLDDYNTRVSNSADKRHRGHICNTSSHSSNSVQLASHSTHPHSLSHGLGHQQGAPYNWQSSRTTVKERLQYMFNNEVMADVHFNVGKGPHTQRIPAHRFVLAISSAVFDAMFNGGMANSSEEIDIPDVEPSAFLALLRFLYTDEVQIGPETVMTTLYTAKKYAIPALERACVEFLKRNLCSENAFMLLTQARLFDEPQLAALCLETIDKNTSEALNAEGFTDIDLDTLCVVLERDTLGIRECKLFGAVCRWAGAEAQRQNLPVTSENQRAVLGRALSLIRFPLMTVEEFAVGAAQSGILTDREVVELFLHFTVNPKPSVNFPDTPRCCLTGKEQVVARFCQIESRWGYSGTSDRIRFMVNRRIFVVGFGLYGSIHGPSEYAVNIQIIHTDTGKVCGQNDTSFQCDGTTATFRVMFKEPVEIQPNTNYTACATLKGPDSYYGTKGLRKVTHESLTSGKVTYQFTYAAGNNNGTSVEDGQLPEIIFYT